MKHGVYNLLRKLLQWGTLLTIVIFILCSVFAEHPVDIEAYCPFGGLQSLATFLHSTTLACSMSVVQITAGIALALVVILFSKLFCSYICPLGTLSEALAALGRKMHISCEIKAGSKWDKILRIVKYALLFTIADITISGSELFCKNFDPFYAMATGFEGEITVWMTILSMAALFLGSLIVRMFWCRYICPLGALCNVFQFAILSGALTIVYVLLNLCGLNLSFVVLLAAVCIVAYLWEIITFKTPVLPLLRIQRDADTCNRCGLCKRKCPQQINIMDLKTVKHPDCTLCGACISACPQESLTVNKSRKFSCLPILLVVMAFIAMLWVGKQWELPTINVRWNGGDTLELASFEREGMRTVKCFGSSRAFAAKMQHVYGVYGVKTYVNRFAVIVYYNPKETNQETIEKAMFSPTKRKLNTPPVEVKNLKKITLGVDHLFDKMDMVFLGNMFREVDGYYGIESQYGCPVQVTLYMDAAKATDETELRRIVGTKDFEMLVHGGVMKKVVCDFEYKSLTESTDTITRKAFLDYMFPKTTVSFRKHLEKFGADTITAAYDMPYDGLDKPAVQRAMSYLYSYFSSIDEFIEVETFMGEECPILRIHYVADRLDDKKIWEIITSPKWKVFKKGGVVETIDARLSFEEEGKTVK